MKRILFILIMTLGACQQGADEQQELKDQVLAIHDEVMPKMGELRNTRKYLMLQADSLISSDSLRAVQLTEAAETIRIANEGMMNWMRNFEPDFEGTDEEVMKYLNDQKEAISKVKEDMESSLAAGKTLIEEE